MPPDDTDMPLPDIDMQVRRRANKIVYKKNTTNERARIVLPVFLIRFHLKGAAPDFNLHLINERVALALTLALSTNPISSKVRRCLSVSILWLGLLRRRAQRRRRLGQSSRRK